MRKAKEFERAEVPSLGRAANKHTVVRRTYESHGRYAITGIGQAELTLTANGVRKA